MVKDALMADIDTRQKVEGKEIQGANRAKRVRRDFGYTMSEDERFVLRLVQNARSACNVLADRIKRGNQISSESIQACSTLSGEIGKVTQS